MSCCKKFLPSVPDSVMKIGSITFYIGLIVYELLDKSVDVATAVEYNDGKLFYNPDERVFKALLVFTIFGFIISLIMRIPLYCWNIYLKYSGDESNDKCYDLFNLGTQSVKVIVEDFPQSAIAKFGFVHCLIKKYGWRVRFLDPVFDGFCGTPFIFFLCCLGYCYRRKHILRMKCCDERDQYEHLDPKSWRDICIYRLNLFCSTVSFFAVRFSVVGLVFASLSFSEFLKRCSKLHEG